MAEKASGEDSIERLRAIADQARDAVVEIAPDSRLLFVSPAFTEVFGYRASEVLGKPARELVHPDDQRQVDEIREQAMSEERPAELCFRFRHADGSWRWIEVNGRPYRTESGELRALLIARDVTGRIGAEAVVRKRLALESHLADVARTFLHLDHSELEQGFERGLAAAAELAGADRAQFFYFAREGGTVGGHFQWCAPGVALRPPLRDRMPLEQFGWSMQQLDAGEVLHIPDPSQLPDEARPEREAMQRDGIRGYLGIPIHHDDRTVGLVDFHRTQPGPPWTEAEIARLRLVSELFSIALRRLWSEQDRAASEERFRTIAENVQDSICEYSLDGRFLYANPAFTRNWGQAQTWNAASDPFSVVHPDDAPQLRRRMASWRSAEDVDELMRYRVRGGDGSWRWLESTARGYRTSTGEERIASVIRDVTEREAAKAELERRLGLEERIAEICRGFFAVEASRLDEAIRTGLEAAAGIAGADRAYLVYGSDRRPDAVQFHDWCAPDVPPRSQRLGLVEAGEESWATRKLLAGELLRLPRVTELPEEAATVRESLQENGVASFLGIPVLLGPRMLGVLGFHCLREQRWSEHEINLLRLVAELFTGAARSRESDAELRESETRFRALAEHARDPIFEIDPQGKIVYASPSATELFGAEGLTGVDFASIIHLDDLPGIYRRCGPQLSTERTGPVQFRARCRDGSWRHIEATARTFGAGEQDSHSVCVLRDVTERHRSQQSLERQLEMETRIADLSQRFLGVAVDEIDGAIRDSLRTIGRVAEADRTWLFHFGDESEAAQPLFEWCAPEIDSHRARISTTTRGSFPWATPQLLRGEVVHIPDPTLLPEEAHVEREDLPARGVRSFLGVPLLSGSRPVGVLGFETVRAQRTWSAETITLLRLVGDIFVSALRRKSAEAQLQQSQHQLLQAQKMEAVGTLAGGIAHDFNNQLTVMLGNARHVLRHVEEPELRDALTDLERAAEHCAQLTRSLLAFSRRTPATPSPLDVAGLVQDVEELLRPLIPSAIDFQVEPLRQLDPVAADPTQLQQVLVNLAVNARDAMPSGGRLRIRARNRRVDAALAERWGLLRPGRYVEIAVIDDGKGMDEETRRRIFEPFFTTKAMGQGTGLGLATAYGIVQECGGAIPVHSRPGEGATFRVLLPRAAEPVETLRTDVARTETRACGTVLLAEDEAAVRRVLRLALEDMGYRVVEAADGVEALQAAEQQADLDALVTDLDMPRMGGMELAERLGALRPELPVVVVSASAREAEARAGGPTSRFRFLQKPFRDAALCELLRDLGVGRH